MPVPIVDTISRSSSPLVPHGKGNGLLQNRTLPKSEGGAKIQGAGVHTSELNSHPVTPNPSRLREAAGKTVGSAFYGTIFQMIRETPFKTKIGHGGRGEEVFSAQLHEILAERLGESKRNNLSDVLFKRLEKQQQLIDAGKIQGSGT